MIEEWRDIEGYEGLYQVSNLGKVRSLDRTVVYKNGAKHFYKGQILKQILNKKGYLVVNLNNKSVKQCRVHRLVAETFIPNPLGLPEVNHKNELKADNSVENLEWCDSKYNTNYGTRNERSGKAHSKPIVQLTIDGDFVARYESTKQAADVLGVDRTAITGALREKHYTAYDCCWWYVEDYKNVYGEDSIA